MINTLIHKPRVSPRDLLNAYNRQLDCNPLRTKMATTFTLFTAGDMISQAYSKSRSEQATLEKNTRKQRESKIQDTSRAGQLKAPITSKVPLLQLPIQAKTMPEQTCSANDSNFDYQRSVRQGILGGAMISPGVHFFVTKVVPKLTVPRWSSLQNVLLRVGVHQACMMPLIQFTFLFMSAFLEPAGSLQVRIDKGTQRFSEKWRQGCIASIMYWPLINFVMYSCVKPKYKSIYCDIFALIFSAVMSQIAFRCQASATMPSLSANTSPFRSKDSSSLPQSRAAL